MSFPMFTRDTLLRLRNTDNINGILLANTTESRPSHYSPEDTCPNRYSGAKECNDKPWNPLGSALLMEDWPFPIFFMQVSPQIILKYLTKFLQKCDFILISKTFCNFRTRKHLKKSNRVIRSTMLTI